MTEHRRVTIQSSRLAALALALCVLPVSAGATPPDAIDIHDELFGVGAHRVLVLRTVTDNLGSYFKSASTVFLVTIDVVTGEERAWPVHRVRLAPREAGGSHLIHTKVITEIVTGAPNPYDRLREESALPAAGLTFIVNRDGVAELDQESLSVRHPEGPTFQLGSLELLSGIRALIHRLDEQMRAFDRSGSMGMGDLLTAQDYSVTDCEAAEAGLVRFPEDGAAVQLARVTCGDLENGVRVSVIRVVPEAAREQARQPPLSKSG